VAAGVGHGDHASGGPDRPAHRQVSVAFHPTGQARQVLPAHHQLAGGVADVHAAVGLLARQGAQHRPLLRRQASASTARDAVANPDTVPQALMHNLKHTMCCMNATLILTVTF
jgi:hypothetical protein